MKGLSLKKITAAVEGILYNGEADDDGEIDGVVIDSRKAEKNYLFVAIKGERADGHDFVRQVFEKGARAVISEKTLDTDKPYILVKSSANALKQLAGYYRSILDIKVVGITGSVGKTSTKEFIASVLSQRYKVLKTAGNFNNEIGLPLTVFNIRNEHQAAVLEMGISDFGEMTRLSRIARPDICVITNIGLCHLENLGSRDGILKAKTEIFKYAKEHYHTVLNGDDDKLSAIKTENENKILFYGMEPGNGIYADNIKLLGIEGSECDIITEKGNIPVHIKVPGKHMIYNAMAAAAVGLLLGLDTEEIRKGIESLENVGGRLNIIKTGKITIIDDCYNANPVSTKSSIDVLEYGFGRKVAILGDMFELGENEKNLHYDVGHHIGDKNIQCAVFIGDLSKNTYEGLIESKNTKAAYYFKKTEEFLKEKDKIIKEGDTVLVKASHSMHFEEIVNALQN